MITCILTTKKKKSRHLVSRLFSLKRWSFCDTDIVLIRHISRIFIEQDRTTRLVDVATPIIIEFAVHVDACGYTRTIPIWYVISSRSKFIYFKSISHESSEILIESSWTAVAYPVLVTIRRSPCIPQTDYCTYRYTWPESRVQSLRMLWSANSPRSSRLRTDRTTENLRESRTSRTPSQQQWKSLENSPFFLENYSTADALGHCEF